MGALVSKLRGTQFLSASLEASLCFSLLSCFPGAHELCPGLLEVRAEVRTQLLN